MTLDAQIPWRVQQHESLESTSTTVQDLCATPGVSPHGLVVRADQQTCGRGRLGRPWSSPPGHLYQSFMVQPDQPLSQGFALAFISAIAVYESVVTFELPGPLGLKWPNDVLLNDKKLAGILIEAGPVSDGDIAAWYCIGVGVNVAPLTEEIQTRASMEIQNYKPALDTISDRLLRQFSIWYAAWLREGFEPIRCAWLEYSRLQGKLVSVQTGGQQQTGLMRDLDMVGGLVIETSDHELRTLTTGEASLVGIGRSVHASGD